MIRSGLYEFKAGRLVRFPKRQAQEKTRLVKMCQGDFFGLDTEMICRVKVRRQGRGRRCN